MEETPNKYTQALKESNVCTDDAIVKSEVEKLLAELKSQKISSQGAK